MIEAATAWLGTASARPGAVWISGSRPAPEAFGWAGVLLVVGALALILAAGLVWRYGSWLDRAKARDLAYRALARRLGLVRAERELVVRAGAAAGGTHPVATLLSEAAFRAMQRRAEPSLSLEESRRLASLGERVFGRAD